MDALILRTIDRLVKRGTLKITTARGATRMFGNGSGTPVAVRFASSRAQRRILSDPELRLGEA